MKSNCPMCSVLYATSNQGNGKVKREFKSIGNLVNVKTFNVLTGVHSTSPGINIYECTKCGYLKKIEE